MNIIELQNHAWRKFCAVATYVTIQNNFGIYFWSADNKWCYELLLIYIPHSVTLNQVIILYTQRTRSSAWVSTWGHALVRGDWKLVISHARDPAYGSNSATSWHNHTSQIDLHKQPLFVWNKICSGDIARWALDRLLWHFMRRKIFHYKIPKETLKCFAYKELYLTWQHQLSEFCPKQTRAVCVNRFHLSLWTPMAAHMITSSLSYLACINNCNLHWALQTRSYV